jgi:DNA-binding MarR family transcriptional regulator
VTAELEGDQTLGRAAALEVFLAFREADLDLWRRAAASLELSPNGMLLLLQVVRATRIGKAVRSTDVRETLRLSAAGASTMIENLVQRQLVRRLPIDGDRRGFTIVATDAGEDLVDDLGRGDQVFLDAIAELEPEHLASFAHVLQTMLDHVRTRFPSTH